MAMTTKRKLYCPECETNVKLQSKNRNGQDFMECPKCSFSEIYKKRHRPIKWFEKGVDF